MGKMGMEMERRRPIRRRDNEQVSTVSTSDSVPLGASGKPVWDRLTGGPPAGQRSIFSLNFCPLLVEGQGKRKPLFAGSRDYRRMAPTLGTWVGQRCPP